MNFFMEALKKSIFEKISSYNIFNYLFPGIVFCYTVKRITRFDFAVGDLLENLFICYFIGLLLSRIGSLVCETILQKITFKKVAFLKYENYDDYLETKNVDSEIGVLVETNNTYRTFIATALVTTIIKAYDWLLYDLVAERCLNCKNFMIVLLGIGITILFVFSFKKQTDYIAKRVRKYVVDREEKNS